MKPPPFKYLAVDSVPAALAAKAQYGGDARFLAGGQSLIPAMNFRLAQPAVLIDINPIPALDYVRQEGSLRIGALTRLRTLERTTLLSEAVAARRPPADPQPRYAGWQFGPRRPGLGAPGGDAGA